MEKIVIQQKQLKGRHISSFFCSGHVIVSFTLQNDVTINFAKALEMIFVINFWDFDMECGLEVMFGLQTIFVDF